MFTSARTITQTLRQIPFKSDLRAYLWPNRPFRSSQLSPFHTSSAKMVPPAARTIVSDHPDKVRMLVLETDEPHPDTQKEKGSFGDILNELLATAGEAHKPKLGIETMMQYIVEPEGGSIPKKEEITDDIHAVLITGSEWDAHGDDKWILELMDLIRRKFVKSHRIAIILIKHRSLDPPSRYPLHWNLLRSPNPLPDIRC
jgi:hypothetical protein